MTDTKTDASYLIILLSYCPRLCYGNGTDNNRLV